MILLSTRMPSSTRSRSRSAFLLITENTRPKDQTTESAGLTAIKTEQLGSMTRGQRKSWRQRGGQLH